MAPDVKYPAKVRIWNMQKTWKRDHPAKGSFGPAIAGQTETLRIPIYVHPCSVCGAPHAPWGYSGIWYCKEHRP